MNRTAVITAAAAVLLACPFAMAGLEVTNLGKTYVRNAAITPDNLYFAASDTGGSTSVRNVDQANLDWKTDGYYQRNRDLGQVFNLASGQDLTLDSIILRTGNSSTAVLSGSPSANLYLQLFEVVGTPTINNNGTAIGQAATHGFTTYHTADDYIEGVTYNSLRVVTGGTFPTIPATTTDGGQAGHLTYLKWDLTGADELTLQGGKRYAFMVGFSDAANNQGFTLGNLNRVGQAMSTPTLAKDSNNQSWWGIRREGDGTLPPTQVPGANPPSNSTTNQQLIRESLFNTNPADPNYHYALSPTTNGYPDVDTYRTLTFYVETKAPPVLPVLTRAKTPDRIGWAYQNDNASDDSGPAQVSASSTSARKAWTKFDLSAWTDIDWTKVQSVTLTLTPSERPTNTTQATERDLHVYGIGDGSFPSGDVTWANGPANDTTSTWDFLNLYASEIGVLNIGGGNLETAGSPLTITLSKAFFQNDLDKIFSLGFSLGENAANDASFKFYSSGLNAPSLAIQYVPEPTGLLAASGFAMLCLRRRRSVMA